MFTRGDPELFRTILEDVETGVSVVDKGQRILFWNTGAKRIKGYSQPDVEIQFCWENLTQIVSPTTTEPPLHLLANTGPLG